MEQDKCPAMEEKGNILKNKASKPYEKESLELRLNEFSEHAMTYR